MELYDSIKEIIDVNIFHCLIPLLFFIILVEFFFRKRFKTQAVLNLVRWFIILYFLIGLVRYLIQLAFFSEKLAFSIRATGTYWFAYWLMLLCALVVPFSLFYKKLALNPFYLLLVVFLMKIGWYFERFVILVTNLHRDYNDADFAAFWIKAMVMQTLQGVALAIILLGIFEFLERQKAVTK